MFSAHGFLDFGFVVGLNNVQLLIMLFQQSFLTILNSRKFSTLSPNPINILVWVSEPKCPKPVKTCKFTKTTPRQTNTHTQNKNNIHYQGHSSTFITPKIQNTTDVSLFLCRLVPQERLLGLSFSETPKTLIRYNIIYRHNPLFSLKIYFKEWVAQRRRGSCKNWFCTRRARRWVAWCCSRV